MLQKLFKLKNPNGVIGLNKRNIELIYTNNRREDYHYADDKVESKRVLHNKAIACAETYAVITNIREIKCLWESCEKYNALAIKPANGFGGDGIKILKKDKHGHWMCSGNRISKNDIFRHITSILSGLFSMSSDDSCLIEECIIPHPFFAEIYEEGVPDFRIITLDNTPLMAMLRMPTSKSDGKANLHQDGVGIGVDMEKGVLTQVYDGKHYSNHHPDNPNVISGKTIPYWDEIIDLSIAASKAFPLNYLGVDIVIDKRKGPQIMELNVRPGLSIQLVNQCGLEKAIEKYHRKPLGVSA